MEPNPLLGSAPLKGSRQLGHLARLLSSSGKADLGQEQPGRGTNDSLSHILQGENPAACVACGAGCSCSLGSFLSQNKSTGDSDTHSLGTHGALSPTVLPGMSLHFQF